MRVPRIERRVGIAPQRSAAPIGPVGAPPGAFGTGVAQATQNLGNTIEKIGAIVANHVVDMQERELQKQVVDLDTRARADIQNVLYNPESDDRGIPTGILQRQGDQAKNGTKEFDAKFKAIHDAYLTQVDNPRQKEAFSRLISGHYLAMKDNVIQHEAAQGREAQRSSFEANLKTRINQSGAITDPKNLLDHIAGIKQVAVTAVLAQGKGQEAAVYAGRLAADEAVKNSVLGVVNKSPTAALTLLETVKNEINPDSYNAIRNDVAIYEKRALELAKAKRAEAWDNTFQGDLSLSFSGKMTLSELQRQYANGELGPGHYQTMAHIVADPAFSFLRSDKTTDPATFNMIRQAQLSRKATRSELLSMIGQAVSEGKLVNSLTGGNDAEYLMNLSKEVPQTPDEKRTDAQASAVRDFGSRYSADHENFIERHFQSESTKAARSRKAEEMVSDFLHRVDQEKATGERIDEIAKEVQGEHIKKDHPEINRLEDLPHIIVGIDGKIRRVLNPEQHTRLKGQFTVTPNRTAPPEKKPKGKAK